MQTICGYQQQIEKLKQYFKKGEKDKQQFKTGVEIEHFILEKDTLEAVSYFGPYGIEMFLQELTLKGYQPVRENEHIIGLNADDVSITLEPGGQFELSIVPEKSLASIEKKYLKHINNINKTLKKYDKVLFAAGYQPVSSINTIPLLPKQRYKYMYEYFKKRGTYAHNMMKGTASIQVNVDYSSEIDFIKKMKVASYLSPVIYNVFDNAPFFEGEEFYEQNVRSLIWNNCDTDRCGLIDGVFSEDFSYDNYADFVLSTPAIFLDNRNTLKYTGETKIKDMFDPLDITEKEVEHFVSMVFPDIRLKKYIEIRMGDSLPYPYSMSYTALWKGLLYDEDNLNSLYNRSRNYSKKEILKIRADGLNGRYKNKDIFEIFSELIDMARNGLDKEEKKYLNYLEDFIKKDMSPKFMILKKLENIEKRKVLVENIIAPEKYNKD
ncbi:MAG: glutamate--cysteine ligase [Halothermotrichaceae bacterium]